MVLARLLRTTNSGGDAQGTGTARRLRCLWRGRWSPGVSRAEQQLLHDAAAFDIAFDTEVVLYLLSVKSFCRLA